MNPNEIPDRAAAPSEIEWLLTKEIKRDHEPQPYGDVTSLNTARTILDAVGEKALRDIIDDYLDLLGTSAAIYETNGDYAHGIFSSGWCRRLDARSRELAGDGDNAAALAGGKWHCHESCWKTSRTSIEERRETDLECHGGIRIFAVPVVAGGEVVGSINFGYGAPPREEEKLREIGAMYELDPGELAAEARAYESRPPYIIELAKKRLRAAARLVGEIVQRKRAENDLRRLNESLEAVVEERTSALKQSVRELKSSNEELETFAYSVAHDLRAPLRSMAGFSRIVAERYGDQLDAQGKDYLGRIRNGAQALAAMIDDLLGLARLSRSDMRAATVDLSALAREIVHNLQREHPERRVAVRIDDGVIVHGDLRLLRIALEHLVENAWKFTASSEEASIAVTAGETPESFSVRDNGIGFDMRHAAKLFQPFQRAHPGEAAEGSGMGLATVQRIAQRHGGRAWVEAVPGEGAVFHVLLSA